MIQGVALKNRREFLKKALQVGVIAGVGVAATGAFASKEYNESNQNGVVSGKTKKKEVLYYKSEAWEKFYKIAY